MNKTKEYYMDPANWRGNKRLPEESFHEYCIRRAHENRASKEYHKGVVFWNSADLVPTIDLTLSYIKDIGGGYMLVLGENNHVSKHKIPLKKVLKRGTYRIPPKSKKNQ